jgi:hypothetical protein
VTLNQLLTRAATRMWPATGEHRRTPGPLAPQQFVHCTPCGVETAATRHGDVLRCTEGHTQPAGGA